MTQIFVEFIKIENTLKNSFLKGDRKAVNEELEKLMEFPLTKGLLEESQLVNFINYLSRTSEAAKNVQKRFRYVMGFEDFSSSSEEEKLEETYSSDGESDSSSYSTCSSVSSSSSSASKMDDTLENIFSDTESSCPSSSDSDLEEEEKPLVSANLPTRQRKRTLSPIGHDVKKPKLDANLTSIIAKAKAQRDLRMKRVLEEG